MTTVDPSYLIPDVRLEIGDINPATYRYTDVWMSVAILAAIKALSRWWYSKYLVDVNSLVYRNSSLTVPSYSNPYLYFYEPEPPVIQTADERPIIIMSAYILQQGSLENVSYNLASWKDNEISYSNLEMSRAKDSNISRLWTELTMLLTAPNTRLAHTIKGSLPGYVGNAFEQKGDY